MKIFPETKKVQALFYGLDLQYQVPRYQRDYAWTKDQVDQLWSDLFGAFEASQDYFLGSIVLMTEGDDTRQPLYHIVDGQQRLTTMTILLCTVRDLAKQFQDCPTDDWFAAIEDAAANREDAAKCHIRAYQAIVQSGEPDRYYLTINDKDQPLFRDKVQKPQRLPGPRSNEMMIRTNEPRVTKAWKRLLWWLHEKVLCTRDGMTKLRHFIDFCLTKVFFLAIEVRDDVDAYLLFESLNDRGLELSIADLVKNRLMIIASPDQERVERVVASWDALLRDLEPSRFGVKDYLRLYWSAFHTPCTSKQLYSLVKRHLNADNVESELDAWRESVSFFLRLTAREQFFPDTAHRFGSLESLHAQMATLKYSVCIPFLMAVNKQRPSMNETAARLSLAYLVRVITVADLSATKADAVFKACLDALVTNRSDQEILRHLVDAPEASTSEFIRTFSERQFEDNAVARYLLTCIHLHDIGGGATPDSSIELEHILPQNEAAWPTFDPRGVKKTDWIYSIGNMTLLEEKVNAALKDKEFDVKVQRYRRRAANEDLSTATAISMTYELWEQYEQDPVGGERRAWTANRIRDRSQAFARKAAEVFKMEVAVGPPGAGGRAQRRRPPRNNSSAEQI